MVVQHFKRPCISFLIVVVTLLNTSEVKCICFLGLIYTLFSPLHIKIIEEIVEGIVEKIPSLINVQEVMNKYPVMYEESMNTVLVQEVIR